MGSGHCLRSTRGSKMVSWSVIAKIQEILQRKMVREFLAEFMSTYVMMREGDDWFGVGEESTCLRGLWKTESGRLCQQKMWAKRR
ncbi:aquaporin 7 [Homo sapiens]|uniref:Aquaporin 7 n=1 Tax=Homo sapiens TaxID=9606 RepID=A0A096LP64_HUMAN|nr:aquaporin 7 [Homo sapiens]KAI4006935.1 aquaporin 7 [Homo sapiens]